MSARTVGLAIALAVLALALPLALVEVPPLGDYANHLARVAIGRQIVVEGMTHPYFDYDFILVPNLLFDIVVFPLAGVLPLEWAGKAFAVVVLALTVAGTAYLHRAWFGAWSLWPVAAAMFAYHQLFMSGFLNYTAGLGIGFFAAGLWLRLASQGPVARFCVGAALAGAVYFTHLFAFLVYGLVVAAIELHRLVSAPRGEPVARRLMAVAIAGAASLPVLGHFAWSLAQNATGAEVVDGELKEGPALIPVFDFSPALFMEKLRWLDLAGTGYALALDLGCLVLLAGVLGYAFVRGRLWFSWPLVGAAGLAMLMFIILPSERLFNVEMIWLRFPIVAVLLAIAGTQIRFSRFEGRAVAAAVGLAVAAKVALVSWAWLDYRPAIAEAKAAFARVEPAAKVFAIRPSGSTGRMERAKPPAHFYLAGLMNLNQLQVLQIAEKQGFASYFFSSPSKQFLRAKPEWEGIEYYDGGVATPWDKAIAVLRAPDGDHPWLADDIWRPTRRWWQDFDYVTVFYPDMIEEDVATATDGRLERVFKGVWMDLYRVQSGGR